ncbi:MAG: hypothetical protein ABF913_02595 [Oenococcus sp.]|uniref:Rgg/GadR/MutR family transcriptional regulator n=1 Tax=Oenococcus sp. TaxID=1979414 RepID=UPI0039E923CE
MVDINYGATFQSIRLDKNIKLSELAEAGITASFIGKFEKGQTRMSVDKFGRLLDKVNVSYAEFMMIGRGFQDSYFDQQFKEIASAIGSHRSARLKHILAQLQRREQIPVATALLEDFVSAFIFLMSMNPDISLAIGTQMTELNHRSLRSQHYLEKVDTWGEFEFHVLARFAFMMPADKVLIFARMAVQKAKKYSKAVRSYDDALSRLLFSLVSPMLYKDLTVMQDMLVMIKSYLLDHLNAENQMNYLFYEGMYWIAIGERKKGIAQTDKMIQIAADLAIDSQDQSAEESRGWRDAFIKSLDDDQSQPAWLFSIML